MLDGNYPVVVTPPNDVHFNSNREHPTDHVIFE